MHAVKSIDVYITLSICVATGGKHGKSQGEIATRFFTVLRGVGGQQGRWHIAVVRFTPASESRITRSITSKLQPSIEMRNAPVLLSSCEFCPLLMSSHRWK